MRGRLLFLAVGGSLYDALSLLLWCLALPASLFSGKLRTYIRSRRSCQRVIRKVEAVGLHPVLLYCSSIGELEQAKSLIDKLDVAGMAHFVFVHSPNGWAHAQRIGLRNVSLTPLDLYWVWKRVFRRCQPRACILNRHEAWPGFVLNASAYSRLFLINVVEKKQKSVLSHLGVKMLHGLCETVFYINRPLRSGPRFVQVGDTRLDALQRRFEAERPGIEASRIQFAMQAKPVLVLGNAYAADAQLLADVLNLQPTLADGWQILVVPARPAMERTIQSVLGRWQQVVAIDASMGRLFGLYQCADVAWIGGGFSRDGIHNTLEAGLCGAVLLSGPNLNGQPDALAAAASDRLRVCRDATACAEVLRRACRIPDKEPVLPHGGTSTERIFTAIFQEQQPKSQDT